MPKHICYECEEPIEKDESVEVIKVDGHPQVFHSGGCAENYRDNIQFLKDKSNPLDN